MYKNEQRTIFFKYWKTMQEEFELSIGSEAKLFVLGKLGGILSINDGLCIDDEKVENICMVDTMN